MKVKVLFFLMLLCLPTVSEAKVQIACACFVDYGLSFEVLGGIVFSVSNQKWDAEEYAELANHKCRVKFSNPAASAQNCQGEEN